MAILTLEERAREYLAYFEQALGQTIPITDRSYLWQESLALGALSVSVDKKVLLQVRENLALTATPDGLNIIGREYLGRDRAGAQTTSLLGSFVVQAGAVVPPGSTFVSDESGLVYESTYTITGTGGSSEIEMVCQNAGVQGNVSIGSVLTLQTPLAGVANSGTVSSVVKTGTNVEGVEEYRTKVLDAIRAQDGGSNMWDYRIWAQEVPGVFRAYPYSGQFDENGVQIGGPSSRTLFVQANSDIDADGIAPQSLLDDVRSFVITDPSNNRNRICMGVPDSTFYVESIRRVSFDVEILGSLATWPSEAVTAIDSAISAYLFGLIPAIDGLDPVSGRTNSITTLNLSDVVQGVAIQYGVSPSAVRFKLSSGGGYIERYDLPAGGLAKAGTITYPAG